MEYLVDPADQVAVEYGDQSMQHEVYFLLFQPAYGNWCNPGCLDNVSLETWADYGTQGT